MPSVVEENMRKGKEVVEASGEMVGNTVKEAVVFQNVVPIPRPLPP